jgi:hypothetical protein
MPNEITKEEQVKFYPLCENPVWQMGFKKGKESCAKNHFKLVCWDVQKEEVKKQVAEARKETTKYVLDLVDDYVNLTSLDVKSGYKDFKAKYPGIMPENDFGFMDCVKTYLEQKYLS